MNAANEVAVGAFIDGRIRMTDIPLVIEKVMNGHEIRPVTNLEVVLETDKWARLVALSVAESLESGVRNQN